MPARLKPYATFGYERCRFRESAVTPPATVGQSRLLSHPAHDHSDHTPKREGTSAEAECRRALHLRLIAAGELEMPLTPHDA